jgi:P-type Cu2+ transporter|tara:strand:- start:75 stop:371 length:297 start_codon:yes stop_codon:yes gene_type:complete
MNRCACFDRARHSQRCKPAGSRRSFLGRALMPVALAVRVARKTMVIVRQNFAFAIIYNVFAVPLALAGMVTPLIAAVAMSFSSLVVVGNSLRLAKAAR